MKVHYLQHVPHEALGGMESWFVSRGHHLSRTRFYAGDALPDPSQPDWLVVMGGPMGVYDEEAYPWLAEEKRFIASVLERDIPVLGVCLGAQLLAEVLGGSVTRNPQTEIGWFPVQLTEAGKSHGLLAGVPPSFVPLHWHGDTFSIPEGAVQLARSEACENQAFAYGSKVLGLQFHVEAMPTTAEQFWEADAPNIVPASFVQSGAEIVDRPERYSEVYPVLLRVLEALEKSA